MARGPRCRIRLASGARLTRAVAALLAALASLATPAAAEEPLEARLEQAWRWRELEAPVGSQRVVRIAPANGRGLIAISNNQIDEYDGHAWRSVVAAMDWPPFDGRYVEAVPGGLVAYDGTRLFSIDARGPRRTLIAMGGEHLYPKGRGWSIGGPVLHAIEGRLVRVTLGGLEDLAPAPPRPPRSGDIDADGRIWVSTDGGPYVFSEGRWRHIPTNMGATAHLTFARVRCTGEETWFLSDPTSGHNNVLRVGPDGERGVVSDQIHGPVWDAVRVPGAGLVAATGAEGLGVLHDGRWTSVSLPIERREQVRDLAWLPSRHLVCLTVSGRIFACDLGSRRWRRYMPPEEPVYANVLAITPARSGGLWVSTDSAVYRFQDGRFTQRFTHALGSELRVVTALHEDERGHLWVGSGSEFPGAFRFDGTEWHRHVEKEGLDRYCVHAIRPGTGGAVWFLLLGAPGERTLGGGVARLAGGTWRRYGLADGLPGARAYDLALTPSGRHYVATSRGLAHLVGDRFERVEALGELSTKRLHVASDGTLWVGQGSAPTQTVLDDGQTILSRRLVDFSAAADFEEDAKGRLWYAAQGGLYMSDGTHEHNVTREPGAPVRSFWPILRGTDDVLWVGGSGKGLVRFVSDDTHAPRILHVEALGGASRTAATVRWRAADRWNATPRRSLRYQWRIDGGAWSAPAAQAEVRLQDLAPGDHVVDVRALDLYGNVGTSSGAAVFTIEPPWYVRATFFLPLLVGLLLLGVGTFLVVRHRRAACRAREGAALYARELLQRANVLLASADDNGTVVYVAPRFFQDYCPYPLEEIQAEPRRLVELLHPDDANAAISFWQDKGRQGTQSGEFRVRHRSGEYRWVLVMTARRSPDGGPGGGWDFVGADITDVKKAQEERSTLERQIQETQKLESLGVLAGGIAHDFNNLLTSILANASLGLREAGPESPVREYLRQIETGAVRASGLTQQMLAYSGKGRFVVEAIDLSALVEEMAHLLRASISKSASLRYDLGTDLPAVMADATQLRQVVMNLITNASEALEGKPGVVSITTGVQEADASYLAQTHFGGEVQPGRYVFVEVSDTGIGMDRETQARLFDPFYTTKATGRGLGLSAVLGIVRGHHGTLKLYSEPGEGTSVKILFPASEEAVRSEPETSDATAWRAEGTVLVVDDEKSVRDVLDTILSTAGFDVISASDGVEGVARFRDEHADIVLVLLDMTMPNMDGAAAFRELRQIKPGVRAILMSGYNAQDATSRFAGKGLAGFIQKPFRPRDLLEKVREVLGSAPPGAS